MWWRGGKGGVGRKVEVDEVLMESKKGICKVNCDGRSGQDTYLDTFDVSTNLIAIPICRPIKEVLYDGVLVVEFTERISYYWDFQGPLNKTIASAQE